MYMLQEWQVFICQFLKNMDKEWLKVIDQKFDFKNWGNVEVVIEWYVLVIKCGYMEICLQIKNFLMKVGRCKFFDLIYSVLVENKGDKSWVIEVYKEVCLYYYLVFVYIIDKILGFKK